MFIVYLLALVACLLPAQQGYNVEREKIQHVKISYINHRRENIFLQPLHCALINDVMISKQKMEF